MRERLWAIVLAGGEGRRLRGLALDERGEPAPKQFCSFGHDRPLLGCAIERAARLVARERIRVSVLSAHRRWWSPMLVGLPEGAVVCQPAARGTAVGVLLPLLSILERDPAARVVVLPSDHAVEEEALLLHALDQAVLVAEHRPDRVVLLGLEPAEPDTTFGWVLPASQRDGLSSDVAAFVEKPDLELAVRLRAAGALWNTFLLAATGVALLRLYQRYLPELIRPFEDLLVGVGPGRLERPPSAVFAALPARDLSRDLLAPGKESLRLVTVPACGWTDLGTPVRLRRWQESRRRVTPMRLGRSA